MHQSTGSRLGGGAGYAGISDFTAPQRDPSAFNFSPLCEDSALYWIMLPHPGQKGNSAPKINPRIVIRSHASGE